MDYKIEIFDASEIKLLNQARVIRETVFIKEQGVDSALEYEGDETAKHYLLNLNDNFVAAARWRKTENGIKLERFAVLKEYRNKGVGKLILDAVLSDALPFGKPIYLNAQEKAVNFYLKNNFAVEGDMFLEAGIKHYKMIYKK